MASLLLSGLPAGLARAASPATAATGVEQLHQQSGGRLLWFGTDGPTAAARALLGQLASAEERGLRSEDYGVKALAGRVAALPAGQADAATLAQLDRDLSVAAAKFLGHLQRGRVRPQDAGYALQLTQPPLDLAASLRALAASPNLAATLDGFEPRYRHYALLKQALARYRRLAQLPVLPPLPPLAARSVKPGAAYPPADALRERLKRVGDLSAEDAARSTGPVLDAVLSAALARFQVRHALAADGTLGAATWRALNVPVATRIQQIELSMERARWLPPPTGGPFILVNIPQFRLFAFRGPDDREQAMTAMNVIVGKTFPQTNTPVFMADMRYVIFRPYWDVPASIMRKEVLPLMRRDGARAEREGFELVRGQSDSSPVVPVSAASLDALGRGELRVRQRPGKDNALGAIKFMLPNRFDVYLHSTPAQSLFSRAQRTFSHGCVRVQEPVALAEFVMGDDPGWTQQRIVEAMQGEQASLRVNLPQPIRVVMFYTTAIAAEDGRMLFFEDIYRHDGRLAAMLGKGGG